MINYVKLASRCEQLMGTEGSAYGLMAYLREEHASGIQKDELVSKTLPLHQALKRFFSVTSLKDHPRGMDVFKSYFMAYLDKIGVKLTEQASTLDETEELALDPTQEVRQFFRKRRAELTRTALRLAPMGWKHTKMQAVDHPFESKFSRPVGSKGKRISVYVVFLRKENIWQATASTGEFKPHDKANHIVARNDNLLRAIKNAALSVKKKFLTKASAETAFIKGMKPAQVKDRRNVVAFVKFLGAHGYKPVKFKAGDKRKPRPDNREGQKVIQLFAKGYEAAKVRSYVEIFYGSKRPTYVVTAHSPRADAKSHVRAIPATEEALKHSLQIITDTIEDCAVKHGKAHKDTAAMTTERAKANLAALKREPEVAARGEKIIEEKHGLVVYVDTTMGKDDGNNLFVRFKGKPDSSSLHAAANEGEIATGDEYKKLNSTQVAWLWRMIDHLQDDDAEEASVEEAAAKKKAGKKPKTDNTAYLAFARPVWAAFKKVNGSGFPAVSNVKDGKVHVAVRNSSMDTDDIKAIIPAEVFQSVAHLKTTDSGTHIFVCKFDNGLGGKSAFAKKTKVAASVSTDADRVARNLAALSGKRAEKKPETAATDRTEEVAVFGLKNLFQKKKIKDIGDLIPLMYRKSGVPFPLRSHETNTNKTTKTNVENKRYVNDPKSNKQVKHSVSEIEEDKRETKYVARCRLEDSKDGETVSLLAFHPFDPRFKKFRVIVGKKAEFKGDRRMDMLNEAINKSWTHVEAFMNKRLSKKKFKKTKRIEENREERSLASTASDRTEEVALIDPISAISGSIFAGMLIGTLAVNLLEEADAKKHLKKNYGEWHKYRYKGKVGTLYYKLDRPRSGKDGSSGGYVTFANAASDDAKYIKKYSMSWKNPHMQFITHAKDFCRDVVRDMKQKANDKKKAQRQAERKRIATANLAALNVEQAARKPAKKAAKKVAKKVAKKKSPAKASVKKSAKVTKAADDFEMFPHQKEAMKQIKALPKDMKYSVSKNAGKTKTPRSHTITKEEGAIIRKVAKQAGGWIVQIQDRRGNNGQTSLNALTFGWNRSDAGDNQWAITKCPAIPLADGLAEVDVATYSGTYQDRDLYGHIILHIDGGGLHKITSTSADGRTLWKKS